MIGERNQDISIILHNVADRPDLILLEMSKIDYEKLMFFLSGVANVNQQATLSYLDIEDKPDV